MIPGYGFDTTAHYLAMDRAATARMTVYSHVRKRCKCGRQTTAKQLIQYQVCDKCWKEENGTQ
jgi:hypothetical protein